MNRIIVGISVLFLFGCNGSSNFESIIQNNSSKSLGIILYNNGFARGDTIQLAPSENRVIRVGESSQAEEEAPECARRIDSALVIVEGGGIMTKDISKNENWDVVTEQTRNIPKEYEHTCTFFINDSDFEE